MLTKGCKRLGQVPLGTLETKGTFGLRRKDWEMDCGSILKKETEDPEKGVTLHNRRSRKRRCPSYREIRMV